MRPVPEEKRRNSVEISTVEFLVLFGKSRVMNLNTQVSSFHERMISLAEFTALACCEFVSSINYISKNGASKLPFGRACSNVTPCCRRMCMQ